MTIDFDSNSNSKKTLEIIAGSHLFVRDAGSKTTEEGGGDDDGLFVDWNELSPEQRSQCDDLLAKLTKTALEGIADIKAIGEKDKQ